jgi:hypothetical protein
MTPGIGQRSGVLWSDKADYVKFLANSKRTGRVSPLRVLEPLVS